MTAVDVARMLAAVAGLCAVASGLAYVLHFAQGGADWAIVAWNVLIIPGALALGLRYSSTGPILAAGATAAGIAASVLWAVEFRNPAVEPWWIGLAAGWWLWLGLALRTHHRATAWLTFALGTAAAIDFVVTLLAAPQPWLGIGGLKIPLTIAWSICIGVVLIRDARATR